MTNRSLATRLPKARGVSSASLGKTAASRGGSLIAEAKLKHLYTAMLQCRMLDEALQVTLEKSKSPRRLPSSSGGEAIFVGAALDLRRKDWIVPGPSDFVADLLKGLSLSALLSWWLAARNAENPVPAETVPAKQTRGIAANILPAVETVSMQLNLAVGVALACRAQNDGSIVMAFARRRLNSIAGASEILGFAAAHRLPLLLVIERREPSKAVKSKSKRRNVSRANSFEEAGVPIIPVDRLDAVAMYRVACEAIHKARLGGGPTVIEASSGAPTAMRTARPLGSGMTSDPIDKMEAYLFSKGLAPARWKRKIIDDFNRQWTAATKTVHASKLR